MQNFHLGVMECWSTGVLKKEHQAFSQYANHFIIDEGRNSYEPEKKHK